MMQAPEARMKLIERDGTQFTGITATNAQTLTQTALLGLKLLYHLLDERSVLTYADVCWRMLTTREVC
jgi:hypothetical protein